MRILVYLLLGALAITTFLSLIGFDVDLAVSSLFYDPVARRFTAQENLLIALLRDHGMVAVWTCTALVALALIGLAPWRFPKVQVRTALFLTVALLTGPGLLVNGILKPHWGRPRPIEVTRFGGQLSFVEWWNPTGACNSNCSFASGEAATAAWMFGPAMVVPPPWRALAIAAAAVFTATAGAIRVAVGGHFFTDTLFGALSTILILMALQRLIGRPVATKSIP